MIEMNDSQFDILLTSDLSRAAEEEYCGDMPSDEDLRTSVKPSRRIQRKMARMTKDTASYARDLQRPQYVRVFRYCVKICVNLRSQVK